MSASIVTGQFNAPAADRSLPAPPRGPSQHAEQVAGATRSGLCVESARPGLGLGSARSPSLGAVEGGERRGAVSRPADCASLFPEHIRWPGPRPLPDRPCPGSTSLANCRLHRPCYSDCRCRRCRRPGGAGSRCPDAGRGCGPDPGCAAPYGRPAPADAGAERDR